MQSNAHKVEQIQLLSSKLFLSFISITKQWIDERSVYFSKIYWFQETVQPQINTQWIDCTFEIYIAVMSLKYHGTQNK